MGKVGSTSIYNSLKKDKYISGNIYHIHRLNHNSIEKIKINYVKKKLKVPGHIKTSEYVLDNIIKECKNAKIITTIREPISRNISAYFQNFELMFQGCDVTAAEVQSLVDNFLEQYPNHTPLT